MWKIYDFPKLEEGGGFELLRAQEGGGKLLNVIPVPQSGYSVNYLKKVVHSAKIYIRPFQKKLSLEPVNDEVGSVQIIILLFYILYSWMSRLECQRKYA